jgi:hypothetical protein
MLYFARNFVWGWALFRFYDDPFRYWPQMAATAGIAVGGIVGAGAAVETGDWFRYFGTAVFLAITLPLYIWKFHLARKPRS